MKCLENMQVCVCECLYICMYVCVYISIIMFIYLYFLVVMIFFTSKYIRFKFMYMSIHNNDYFYPHKSIRISFSTKNYNKHK